MCFSCNHLCLGCGETWVLYGLEKVTTITRINDGTVIDVKEERVLRERGSRTARASSQYPARRHRAPGGCRRSPRVEARVGLPPTGHGGERFLPQEYDPRSSLRAREETGRPGRSATGVTAPEPRARAGVAGFCSDPRLGSRGSRWMVWTGSEPCTNARGTPLSEEVPASPRHPRFERCRRGNLLPCH